MKSISKFTLAAAVILGTTGTAMAAPCLPNDPDPTCTQTVPEPGSLALVGLAIAGMVLVARKSKK